MSHESRATNRLILQLLRFTILIQGILTEFLLLLDVGNCKNFASSAVNNDYDAWGYELP